MADRNKRNDNVLIFKSRHELEHEHEHEHEKNIKDFIQFGEKLPLLNYKYEYKDNYWPRVCNFTIFGVSSKDRNPENLLHKSLIPFAKAYIAYGTQTAANINSSITAFRAINAVFSSRNEAIDLSKLKASDFDQAALASRKFLKQGAAYNAGRGLKKLLTFLVEEKMITPFEWKNPIKKALDSRNTSEEAEEKRQKKMPDEDALMAIAEISAKKDDDLSPRDVFTTSTITILLSAPARGSEPMYLLADCLHYQTMEASKAIALGLSEEDVLGLLNKQCVESEEKKHFFDFPPDTRIKLMGVKWYSGKGYGYEVKWVPTVMYDVVETAVKRLQALSARARAFAKIVEDTPLDKFPHHELCPDVPEDQLLTKEETAQALGVDIYDFEAGRKRMAVIYSHLKAKGVSRTKAHTLRDLNPVLRGFLPKSFPYVDYETGSDSIKIKWSDALYVVFQEQLSDINKTTHTQLFMPHIDILNSDLAPTKKRKRNGELSGILSIFQRWGYGDMSITSHQLRHMLDTMAAVNGMEGQLRAKWAMRSDPRHNRYYDHTTEGEYGHDFREARESEIAKQEGGSSQIVVQIATPRTIQELNTKASLSAHSTEFGMCPQSYLSEPCTKYRDCANCSEHICVKGDDGKCERLRKKLATERKFLKMDEVRVQNGVQGADQWYRRRQITVDRCEQLVKMMEDPNIEDGALIKLVDVEDVTLLDRAMDANGKKRLPEIINYQRINHVSVDEMVGIDKSDSSGSDSSQLLDEMEDLDDLDSLWEDENG